MPFLREGRWQNWHLDLPIRLIRDVCMKIWTSFRYMTVPHKGSSSALFYFTSHHLHKYSCIWRKSEGWVRLSIKRRRHLRGFHTTTHHRVGPINIVLYSDIPARNRIDHCSYHGRTRRRALEQACKRAGFMTKIFIFQDASRLIVL
jgi:hypothetical protein